MTRGKLIFDEADFAVARMREQVRRAELDQTVAEALANIRHRADELCYKLRAVAAAPPRVSQSPISKEPRAQKPVAHACQD